MNDNAVSLLDRGALIAGKHRSHNKSHSMRMFLCFLMKEDH